MGFAVKRSKVHPYITRKKGVCGSRSFIEGTRIPVAFSYYYDNRKDIEGDIQENEDEALIRDSLNDKALSR